MIGRQINIFKSLTVVLWHIKCSVACLLPTCLHLSYQALWPQNTSLLPPGPAARRWTRWRTGRLPPPASRRGPAGRSTCCSWCCSSAWCCPSSSAPWPCCSVWCSRGTRTGWAARCSRLPPPALPGRRLLTQACSNGSTSWHKRSRSPPPPPATCLSGSPSCGGIRGPRPSRWWWPLARPLHGRETKELLVSPFLYQ